MRKHTNKLGLQLAEDDRGTGCLVFPNDSVEERLWQELHPACNRGFFQEAVAILERLGPEVWAVENSSIIAVKVPGERTARRLDWYVDKQ